MGREYRFYAFSLSTLREHLSSGSDAARGVLTARLAEHARDPNVALEPSSYEVARGVADALTRGTWAPERAPLEHALAAMLIEWLLDIGQRPVTSPPCERFAYALTQVCVAGGAIDDHPLASTNDERRVVTYLAQGRSFVGETIDRHSARGWLSHGAETRALAGLVASSVWRLYTESGRFQQSAVAAFERERATLADWLEQCERADRDVLFTTSVLPGAASHAAR